MPPIILGKSPDASSFTVNDIEGRKPVKIHAYSASQVGMAMKCPRMRYFRYRLGLVIPPPGVVILGRGVHKGIEESLRHKQRTGKPLDHGEVKDIAATETERIFDDEPCQLEEGEDTGNTVDAAARLAVLWSKEVAPERRPIPSSELAGIAWPKMPPRKMADGSSSDSGRAFDGIESGFELHLKGIELPIIGFIDFLESAGKGKVNIRDNKTTGRKKKDVDLYGFQIATYVLVAMKAQLDVKKIGLDVLIRPTRNRPFGESDIMEGSAPTIPLLQQTYAAFKWLENMDKNGEYPAAIGDHCGWCGYRKLCEKTGKIEKIEV